MSFSTFRSVALALSSFHFERRCLITFILTLTAFASLLRPLSATEIVFDTFGPGDSYDGDSRYSTGQGFQFEPTQTGALASITVALGRQTTATTESTFSLFEADGLNFGPLLESFDIANTTPALPSPGAIVTIDSVLQPILLAGQSYWLYFSDSTFGSLWFFNDQAITGIRTTGQLATLPAFRVEVVSEPSAGLLLVVGLALLGVSRSVHRARHGSAGN